jgi:SulP family sulfate permease
MAADPLSTTGIPRSSAMARAFAFLHTLTERWGSARYLVPFLAWLPQVNRRTFRPDLEAGLVSAIIILPQAIALATLAGMPPEYGIYTSIFPVMIASIWGSSWHTLSGPNTAVCVLIAYSVAPFASVGTEHYIGYVLALTLMVGVIQLAIGFLRLGGILDFISHNVINAIVMAVALVIIVSAASAFLGVLSNIDEPFFIRLYQVVHDIPRANGYAVAIGSVTVATGLVMRRYWRRYALVIAVIAGTAFSVVMNLLLGPANTNVELLGHLSLSLLPFSAPSFNLESMYVLKELLTSALAIAFLGLMQTVVISRSIAMKSSQHIDTNQEIIGQGLSNIIAPFVSSFANSGSFNRSAAHYEAGALTPMAAVYASVILFAVVLGGTALIAYMPIATVAGALILVGYGLIDLRDVRIVLRSRQESIVYLVTFLTALTVGLNAGVFTGLFLSLVIYMWYAAKPNINIEEYTARNGRNVQALTIDGNLFFGSVRHVEKVLEDMAEQTPESGILLVRTDHLTYMDVSGANLIAAEIRRQLDKGGDVYIYVTRPAIIAILDKAGLFDTFGRERIIEKTIDHPMKDVLYPYRQGVDGTVHRTISRKQEEITMEALAKRLRTTRLLGPLTFDQINMLLGQASVKTAPAGSIIIRADTCLTNHLILQDGEVEIQRTWSVPGNEYDMSSTRSMRPEDEEGSFGFLSAASCNVRVRAVTDIRFILINADDVDELLGWSQQFATAMKEKPEIARRMRLVKSTGVFHHLPLENVITAFERMTSREVQAGETIVTQGEEGDCYYLIDEGEADVIRTDPFTDETRKVAVLGTGDAFGEEALLQGGYRNATVTMTSPGHLLVLEKSDFDELFKAGMVGEINAGDAHDVLEKGERQLVDCRYDMEYEESRIPGAQFVPLDQIRDGVHALDPDIDYIVYCRSGRRSKAAAYLLKERNIDAVSLAGGIKDWPYEVDTSPLDLAAGD